MTDANQKIIEGYTLQGWPNHFFTMEAVARYNNRIKLYAMRRKGNKDDLSLVQKIDRRVYIWILNIYDSIIYSKHTGL